MRDKQGVGPPIVELLKGERLPTVANGDVETVDDEDVGSSSESQ